MRRQREREETKLEPSEWTERPNDHGPAILGAYATAHACRAHPTHTSDIPLLTLEPCRRWISMFNRVQCPSNYNILRLMPHSTPNISSANPTSLVRVGFSMQSRFVRQQTKLRSSCQTRERRRRRRRPAWHRQPQSGRRRARVRACCGGLLRVGS